ncbi:pyridoxal phosphate-dependent aminotransferase [Sporosalibacterium faouarense]|uniref:pyridoxal phosphate-dependent aminotransferase n=1 Tax=Sporosalibacterium faouarense TaxID=516123 RepID=UPI00141D7304|nr:pyridoxal phosphate-dependent aminotransferase [Sporosalibacterium faouarense]MTI46298.1 pyridoxal phosphate-dependent aminotransferase [Bacillota bacterium]
MRHKFISKRYWKDKSTPMGAVDELAKKYENVIDLSLGDPDQNTDEGIIRFAFQEAIKGHTKYTDFRGDPELRDEIKKFYKEDHKVDILDEEIMVSTSACLGMYLVLESILDIGDEVIIHAPYFTPYYQQIELANGVPVELETLEEEEFQINIEKLEQTINERTRAIIINSPNNPTGAVFSLDTLNKIADIAIKYDLLIIADEIYGAYTFKDDFISMISMHKIRDRLIILNSFSKDYVMTGWRIGNIIAPKEIISTCQLVNENVVFTAPSVSQRAAIYALRNRKSIQPPLIKLYKERVLYSYKRINNISWMSVPEPKGTFYLYINIKKTGLSSEEISKIILDKAKVLTIPGNSFGTCGEGYIRIACTVGISELEKAFDRIAKIKL